MQTNRSYVDLKDCIPHYAKFESKVFNDFIEVIKTKRINTSNMDFEYEMPFYNIKLSAGCGGLHGSIRPGIYKSDENNMRSSE